MSDANEANRAEPAYLIRKGDYWLRPNGVGYTCDVKHAGRFANAEAERIVADAPWRMEPVPLSSFRVPSPEVIAYARHLRDLGFTVIAPNDMLT